MNKIAVVYWSCTGNTEAMAQAVLQGIQESGADGQLYTSSEFAPEMLSNFGAIAFGCPAMGDEVLEETEFEPLFEACKPELSGKKVALFGSYGWGDGAWMRSWEDACKEAGVNLVCDSVICNETPDEEGIANCKALGVSLAE